MKHLLAYFFTLFIAASLCPVVTAMEQLPDLKPLAIRLDLIRLDETTPDTTPASPTTPTTRTAEEQEKLNNDLYTACKGSDRVVDLSLVAELLGLGADINTRGIGGNTPLQVACYLGFENLVDILLADENIKIDAQNDRRFSALYMASGNGFEGIVQKLLTKGANKELADVDGFTALHAAVQYNRLGVVTLLLDAGAIVNAPNNEGVLPIHMALLSEPINLDLVTLIIRNKANLGAADTTGLTPLKIVFTSPNIDLSLCLINADVNEDVRRAFEPFFLNAMFCVNKDIRILQALLAKGMDKNIALQNKWTPLHFACGLGCMDIAEYLIREGADLEIEAIDGRTPLELIRKKEDSLRLLTVVTELMLGRNAT